MRLANKHTMITGRFKPKYFDVKKDRKNGIVLISPPIDWKKLSEQELNIQWAYCLNVLWEKEKENLISKDDLASIFYKVLEVFGTKPIEISQLKRLKDWEIPFTMYSTAFLLFNGATNHKQAILYFNKKIKELSQKAKNTEVQTVSTGIKQSIKDTPIQVLIGKIHELEDNMLQNVTVDWKKWAIDNKVTKEQFDAILKFYSPIVLELNEAKKGKCEQLNEAYKKQSKALLTFKIKWYMYMLEELQVSADYKKPEKIRKVKPKTPDKIVKKLKYNTGDTTLGIKSINPTKIVGSSVLWLYNTKTRKLVVYQAKSGYTLSIEGSTLVNWDESTSFSKTLRKPEIQLKEFMSRGKKPMFEYYKNIKSKDSPVSGRINRDVVLLTTY